MTDVIDPRSPDAWDRVQALFHAALALPATERQAFLERECADVPLRDEVRGLLDEDARGPWLLDGEIGQLSGDLLDADGEIDGRRFGPYRLVRRIGEGGSSVVFLGERSDLGTTAAIKVLRDAWLLPERRVRFSAEQRTLAQLNHPSIARLYDADTLADGTPYFVMEHVEGVSITEHCTSHQCSIAERLRLFRAVCEAVQHAHRNLVIHRDLKPSNILVTATGDVKLLDFGIAKPIETLDSSSMTRTGVRLMTPAYAAPEQITGERLGTFTDIYALGVVLYELLTGRLPYDLGGKTHGEAERLMLEQPVPPPSTVAPRGALGRAAWADLDVLCLTAMQPDPSRRYQTVDALIRDLDHYTHRQPLEARRDSTMYRLGKFVRRHAPALSAAALVMLVIVGLVAFYTLRLTAARNVAVTEATRAQRIQRFMNNLFTGGDTAAGPADEMKVVTLLDRGVQEARSLDSEPVVQADLYATLGRLFQKLGKLDRADELLKSALERRTALFGDQSAEVADSLISLGELRHAQASFDEAERLIRDGRTRAAARLGPTHPAVARAAISLGEVLESRGSYDKAVPVLEEAVRLTSAPGSEPADLADSLAALANTHFYLGHFDESERLNRRVLDVYRQLYGEKHPYVADTLINLGAIELDRARYPEAVRFHTQAYEMYRAWYGEEHPETASAATHVGRALSQENRLDEAAAMMRQALRIQEQVYGQTHPRVASALNEVGLIALKQGRLDDAERNFARMADVYKAVYNDKHYYIGVALSNLGGVYQERGQYSKAEDLFREVLRRYADVLPAEHQLVGIARVRLGRQILMQRRFADAERESLAGYNLLMKQSTPPLRWVNIAREDLAAAYDGLQQPARARQFRDELEQGKK